jgi:hypothetical protein
MLGLKRLQVRKGSQNGVLYEILRFGQATGPLRKPAARPALQRRYRSLDQQADRVFVSLLESLEQVERAEHPDRPVRQSRLLHSGAAHGISQVPVVRARFPPRLKKRSGQDKRTQPFISADFPLLNATDL